MPTLDFDALWAEREAAPLTVRAFGELHELPPAKPAGLTLMVHRVRAERGPDAKLNWAETEQAARYIFGAETIDRFLTERSCSEDQLADLVLYVLAEYHQRAQADATAAEDDEPAPGSFGTPEDVIAHIATIEADFQATHGIDLAEALDADGLSWRRFRNLLTGLPADSGWSHLGRKAAKSGVEAGVAHLRSVAQPAAG